MELSQLLCPTLLSLFKKVYKQNEYYYYMKKINFLFFVLLILSITFVLAQPPTTVITDYQRGVDIIHPETQGVKFGEDLEFNFWTYNFSDGATLTNTSLNCTFYIVDNKGVQYYKFSNQPGSNGLIKYGKGAPLCVNCWTLTMPKENLSLGLYSYQIKCQGSGIGGYATGFFEVTPTGTMTEPADSLLYILFLGILFLMMFGLFRLLFSSENKYFNYGIVAILYVISNVFLLIMWKVAYNYLYIVPFIGTLFEVLYKVSSVGYFILFPVLLFLMLMEKFRETNENKFRQMGYDDDTIRFVSRRKR